MKEIIWISYDLDLRGDYKKLYAWLDEKEAKECGDSVAVLSYEYRRDLIKEIKSDLVKAVPEIKNARIYVVRLNPKTKVVSGRFLFGNRTRSPWFGYARDKADSEDQLEAV